MRQVRLSAGRRRMVFSGVLAVSILAVVVALQASAASGKQTAPARANGASVASHATAGCSSVKRGGNLNYGVDQDVISFDAANTQDNGSLWADMNIYDQLVRLNPDGSK